MLARRWHTAIVFYRCYHFFQRESHHSHHEGLVRFQCALELLEHQTITRKMGGMDHLPMPQTNSSVTSRRTNASDHRDILVGLWCELLLIKRESEWKQIRTRGEPTPVTLTIIFIPIWESGFLTEHSWENGNDVERVCCIMKMRCGWGWGEGFPRWLWGMRSKTGCSNVAEVCIMSTWSFATMSQDDITD